MLSFKPITLSDKTIINSYLDRRKSNLFTYSFEVLYLWRDVYDFQYAVLCDMLLMKTCVDGRHYFLFPAGNGDTKTVLENLFQHAEYLESPFLMGQITQQDKKLMERLFPDKFNFIPARGEFEYLYDTGRLASLSGNALQAKRNNINFLQNHHSWEFAVMTPDNLHACIAYSKAWDDTYNDNPKSKLFVENKAIYEAFDHFEELGLDGGLLRIDGEIKAITMGCRLNDDVYLCLFEKANHLLRGAYTLINREFVRRFATGYNYVNRAEDGGVEGLRQAKLSYHPAILLEVFQAVLK